MVAINKNMKRIIRILLNITATLGLIFGIIELTGGFLLLDEVRDSKKSV